MRHIYKTVVRVIQFRFLATSLDVIPTKPTKSYENDAAAVTSITGIKIKFNIK